MNVIAKKKRDLELSELYVQQCYTPQTTSGASCNTFPRTQFNWTTTNGDCPFNEDLCLKDSNTIVFDTGLLDSHQDFGLNGREDDQIFYRRVTNCTVLNDAEHVTDWITPENGTSSLEGWKVALANYGMSLMFPNTSSTYEYSNFADFSTKFQGQTTTPYQLAAQMAYSGLFAKSPSTFIPIPELAQNYADLSIMFLSFTGFYAEPIDDPWFAAHQVVHRDTQFSLARTTYTRDHPISTMGCTEQHQVCTRQGGCTPLLGFYPIQDYVNRAFRLSDKQNVTLDRIFRSTTLSSLFQVVDGLTLGVGQGGAPLMAANVTAVESSTLSLGLPSDQWQLEAAHWHAIGMAHLQRMFLEFGTGQIVTQTDYISKPKTAGGKWICNNMTMQGTSMQSFSVLSLVLILALGTTIITISMTIENLASRIQKRTKGASSRMEMWEENDMLQLHLWTDRLLLSNKRPHLAPHRSEADTVAPHSDLPQKDQPRVEKVSVKEKATLPRAHLGDFERSHAENAVKYPKALPPIPFKGRARMHRNDVSSSSPTFGRMIQAVSSASYQEGFRAGHPGNWI